MRTTRTVTATLAILTLAATLTAASPAGAVPAPRPTPPANTNAAPTAAVADAYGKLPLSFEVNQGQADPKVRFTSKGKGRTLFLTATDAVLSLTASGRGDAGGFGRRTGGEGEAAPPVPGVLRMHLEGANPDPEVVGGDKLPGVANYLTGGDRSRWHTNIPTFARVEYGHVYPGVDQVWYGHEGQLEHDFVVAPGADPSVIEVVYGGVDRLSLNDVGDLVIDLPGGVLTEHAPRIYQDVDGQRRTVSGSFQLLGDSRVGFAVGDYDRSEPVVIDPTLVYSTYLGGGGGGTDQGFAIAVDGMGAAYVTGTTDSTDFPVTPGALDMTYNGDFNDAFVTKLAPGGGSLSYSTYLGGAGDDLGLGIAVDGGGEAWVSGTTDSRNFPTTSSAFQGTFGGGFSDAFVTKLNATGSGLAYSTYLGGSDIEAGGPAIGLAFFVAVAVDSFGDAYVAGNTRSTDFPVTAGALRTTPGGGREVYVTKLDPDASGTASLAYSTYLGGSDDDTATALAVDGNGAAYVTGETQSTDFPVMNAFQGALNGPFDVFVSKLDPDGGALAFSTYLGGSTDVNGDGAEDEGFGIAVDGAGAAYVMGLSPTTDFPTTPGAFQTAFGGGFTTGDSFVAKFDTTASGTASRVYATYLGGSADEFGTSVALDPDCVAACSAYVTGFTISTDFPTTQGGPPVAGAGGGIPGACAGACPDGNIDSFVTKLDASGASLVYSTYLGGSAKDEANDIAVDADGAAYVVGLTQSIDFPTVTPVRATNAGDRDVFVTKVNTTGSALVYSTYLGGAGGSERDGSIAVDRFGAAYVSGTTEAIDFPTTPGTLASGGGTCAGFGTVLPCSDVFVAKLNPAGSALVYSTYLGGSEQDAAGGIAVDRAGAAYVTGFTRSADFPAAKAAPFCAGSCGTGGDGAPLDAFVTKLDPSGSVLAYSNYLGGSDSDSGDDIAVDGAGAAYVTGFAGSTDFPTTPGAFQGTLNGGGDAFVTKVNPSGSALAYSTYLGGTDYENTSFTAGIAVDGLGNAYVTGETFSTDFPTTAGAFQTTFAIVFVAKVNPGGSALVYSTYLGGTDFEIPGGIALRRGCVTSCDAYVTGTTGSPDFPTSPDAFDLTLGGFTDAFVSRLNASGSALLYSTYLGGSDSENFFFGSGAIAVDDLGNAYVTGTTGSPDFPTTPDALDLTPGGFSDAFVTSLNPSGSALRYSTYLGGNSTDGGNGIAVDGAAGAYITGQTFSVDFPTTPGAFQTTYGGGSDAFVTKISIPTGGGAGGDDGGDGGGDPSKPSGRITIIQDGKPDRTGSFGFHTKNLKQKTFKLAGDRKQDFKDLKAGTYTVAQDGKDGWTLDRIACTDPTHNTKVKVDTRRATIKLKAGEHVTCTFTDRKK